VSEPSLLSSVSPDGAFMAKDGVSGSDPLSDALYPAESTYQVPCNAVS
jgi:hypothetical protein